jgi:hypothetical protein
MRANADWKLFAPCFAYVVLPRAGGGLHGNAAEDAQPRLHGNALEDAQPLASKVCNVFGATMASTEKTLWARPRMPLNLPHSVHGWCQDQSVVLHEEMHVVDGLLAVLGF